LKPLPIRRIVAVALVALCICLAFANHYDSVIAEQAPADWGFGAPPPPLGQFLEAFLVMPGTPAGLPVMVIGWSHGPDWLVDLGLILGAAFFWYAVAWYVDWSRGATDTDKAPKLVRAYLSTLQVLSVLVFPLVVCEGFSIGRHFCASGVPPLWAEQVMFGIMMTWVTIGAFFACHNFRKKRELGLQALFS
jgi:hypothetical protein